MCVYWHAHLLNHTVDDQWILQNVLTFVFLKMNAYVADIHRKHTVQYPNSSYRVSYYIAQHAYEVGTPTNRIPNTNMLTIEIYSGGTLIKHPRLKNPSHCNDIMPNCYYI